MQDYEKSTLLSSMSGEKDPDVLNAYLMLAGQAVIKRAFPFATDGEALTVPDKYISDQLEIACYLLNKRGAEGQISHNENGINRSYESASIPESMLSSIVPFAGVIK